MKIKIEIDIPDNVADAYFKGEHLHRYILRKDNSVPEIILSSCLMGIRTNLFGFYRKAHNIPGRMDTHQEMESRSITRSIVGRIIQED